MKSRSGYLYKRGDNFYVSAGNGKLFIKALRDSNGQPITSKREAEEAKEKFMAPMAKADEAEAWKPSRDSKAGRLSLSNGTSSRIQHCRSVRHGLNFSRHQIAPTLARKRSINTNASGAGLLTG